MSRDLVLRDGSQIAIIGGGPAGSFFAHFVQKFALEKGISLSTKIFDGKDFLKRGPKGCNLCAGVIAESLNQKLKEEGIYLPEKRIINRVEGYCLHVNGKQLFLSCAEDEKNAIATVFRGNGPRFSTYSETISFDDYLLTWAQDHGAEVISRSVWEVGLSKDKTKPAYLYYGEKDNPQKFEADLIVGAFGLNTHLMQKMQNLGFGYKPPSTLMTYQAELRLGAEKILKHFGNTIHVYTPKSRTIRYATVIPKGDYITVSLIGNNGATKDILHEFLCMPDMGKKISPSIPHCSCYPRIMVSPSKQPFTHRLVMIGDSSFSRHYKNGLESAFITAKLAAESAVYYGVDSSSFSSYYFKQAKRLIIRDNYYGRFLFFMNDLISSVPLLTQSHLSLAECSQKKESSKKLRAILWGVFTGNIPYKDIFKIALDIKLQYALLVNTISLFIKKLKRNIINFC